MKIPFLVKIAVTLLAVVFVGMSLFVLTTRRAAPGGTRHLNCDSCVILTKSGPRTTGEVVHMPTTEMAIGACAERLKLHSDFVSVKRFSCRVSDSLVQTWPKK